MRITRKFLQRHEACAESKALFSERFPAGADVEDVLRALCETGHADWCGSLYLGGCTGLTALPTGLTVSGSLYLKGCTGLTKGGS